MNKPTKRKIIQLIPAERGWHVSWVAKDTDGRPELRDGNVISIKREVACWALNEAGEVVPMVVRDEGNGLAQAQEETGWDFNVYSPTESWKYLLTSAPTGIVEPPSACGDAEVVSMSGGRILWRWV